MIHLLSQTSDGVTFTLDSAYCVDILKWDFIGQDLILIFVLLIILNNIEPFVDCFESYHIFSQFLCRYNHTWN